MDVVADDKPVTIVWVSAVTGVNTVLEVILGDLNLLGGQLVVVVGIEIEVGNDVTKITHNLLALGITRRVRRAHVCGIFADDVTDGHLVLDHLIVNLLLRDETEVLVGPGVGSDLMAIVIHLLDDACPVFVNGTFSDVVSSDEEGSVGSTCLKLGHNVLGVDVWAIVVGDRNGSWVVADVNTSTTVGNGSLSRAVVIAGGCSSRSLVGIARRSKVEQAVRCLTVFLGSTAVSGA
jgi:hypothetical protein